MSIVSFGVYLHIYKKDLDLIIFNLLMYELENIQIVFVLFSFYPLILFYLSNSSSICSSILSLCYSILPLLSSFSHSVLHHKQVNINSKLDINRKLNIIKELNNKNLIIILNYPNNNSKSKLSNIVLH